MKSLRKIFVIIAVLSTSCSTAPEDRKTYFVLSNGARLPVYENGPDTDKIILFTHGGPGASGVVNYHMPFFQELARHYKVIFWDQRGSGGGGEREGIFLRILLISVNLLMIWMPYTNRWKAGILKKRFMLWVIVLAD